MATTHYTILTDVGAAKVANAIRLGTKIEVTELAVGDGGGKLPMPGSSATKLVNEWRRAPINTSFVDDQNDAWVVFEQVLPPDVGGHYIREIGLYDAAGDLIAIGNYPEQYKPLLAEGASTTQTVRVVIQVLSSSAVTLKVDPSTVLATRSYVDKKLEAHEKSRNHPYATTTLPGMAELATGTEAKARADKKVVLTPETGGQMLAEHEQAEQAHNAAQIKLAAQLSKFADAETVQAVLSMLGSAALKDAGAAPLLTLDDFTKGQILGPRGVQPLPGGLILQWAEIVVSGMNRTSTSNGMTVVMHDDSASGSLPIPFPNECLARAGSFGDIAESFIENMTLDATRTGWTARACGLGTRPAGTAYTIKGTAFFLGR